MAVSEGADYIAVGAMHHSNSKSNTRDAGVETLQKVKGKEYDIPVVAIGGINHAHIPEVMATGAAGVAVVRAIMPAKNPDQAASELKKIMLDSLPRIGTER